MNAVKIAVVLPISLAADAGGALRFMADTYDAHARKHPDSPHDWPVYVAELRAKAAAYDKAYYAAEIVDD